MDWISSSGNRPCHKKLPDADTPKAPYCRWHTSSDPLSHLNPKLPPPAAGRRVTRPCRRAREHRLGNVPVRREVRLGDGNRASVGDMIIILGGVTSDPIGAPAVSSAMAASTRSAACATQWASAMRGGSAARARTNR
jgi:hypothetical protein